MQPPAGWRRWVTVCLLWALACGKPPDGALRVDVSYRRLAVGPDCITVEAAPSTGSPGTAQLELGDQPLSTTLAVGVEREADWSQDLTVRGALRRGGCDGGVMATDVQTGLIPRSGRGEPISLLLVEASGGGSAGGAGGGSAGGAGGGTAGGSAGGAGGGTAGGSAGGAGGGTAGGSAGGAGGGTAGGLAGGAGGGTAGGMAGGAGGGTAGGSAGGAGGGTAGGSAGGAGGGTAGGTAGGSAGGAGGGTAGGSAGGNGGGAAGGTASVCSGTGLVACYAFDEGSGKVANDGTGHGHQGTVISSSWGAGHGGSGTGVVLDGGSVSVPHDGALQPTGALTLEAWINPTEVGTDNSCDRIIDKGYISGAYGMGLCGSGLHGRVNQVVISGTAVINAGQWTHVAMTWDGATIRSYVNGVLDDTTALGGTLPGSTLPLIIGNTATAPGTTYEFHGTIDEVRIWSVARTAAEVCVTAGRTWTGSACN